MGRSYAKESKKSKPVGIRYNLEDFETAKKKSGKNTAQALFDFLLTSYVYGSSTPTPSNSQEIPSVEILKFKQPTKDFRHYSKLIPELTFEDEYRQFTADVQASDILTSKEKETLLLALKNR